MPIQMPTTLRCRARARRESGLVTVFTVLGLSALLALVALAVDVGWMLNTRTQLQNAADATAKAALQAFLDEGTVFPASGPGTWLSYELIAANDVAVQHVAGDAGVQLLLTQDIQFGFYDFTTRAFAPGLGFGAPAARVTARRSEGSPAGPLQLFFAPLVGITSANVRAEAVAAIRRRDLVIIQDRTRSFQDTFDAALLADKALVDAMAMQQISGDRVGLVTFARDAIQEQPLTALTAGGQSTLKASIDGFEVCVDAGEVGGPCYGTDIGAGIDRARQLFADASDDDNAERVVVIVSDGLPCFGEFLPSDEAVTVGQGVAETAANAADAEDINIFVVTLDQGGRFDPVTGEDRGPCFGSDLGFNESLARGFGRGFTTAEEDDLDDLLRGIARQMPVHLVR